MQNKTKFINRKTYQKHILYAIILASILIGSTVFLVTRYATANPSPSSTPVFETPVAPYSYLVWRDGSTYYAKIGYGDDAGEVKYSGTNAHTVIDNAWNTLSSGGNVHFGSGTYVIDQELDIPYDDIGMYLEKGAVFQAGASINMLDFNGKNRIIISGGEFDGQKSSYDSQGIIGMTSDSRIENIYIHHTNNSGVFVSNCTNLILDGVVSKYNGKRGIYVTTTTGLADESDYCKIINCHTEEDGTRGISASVSIGTIIQGCTSINDGEAGSTSDGIHIEANTDLDNLYLIVDSNLIVNNARYGINVVSYTSGVASRIVISNNVVINPTGGGIRIYEGSGGETTDIVVEGNNVHGSSTQGIIARGYCQRVAINNNIVTNSTSHGIELTAYGCTVSNNILFGNGGSGAIYLNGGSGHTLIGNVVNNNDYGIIEAGVADYNIIVGCDCRDNTGYNIYTVGSNTHVNLCWNGTTWIP